jgi:D-alanine-D-alanine ligase
MMLIGLTYDLRADYLAAGYSEEETAELDRPDTIDAIDTAIRALGHRTDRIGGARDLVKRLAAGARWDLVFNIAEGIHGIGRESAVPAILDLYEIPCTFSDPLVMALALHKGFAKQIVRAAGVATPDFVEIRLIEDISLAAALPLPLFVKPIAEGTGKGVTADSVVRDRSRLRPLCEKLLARYAQPVLIESFLPGREFTVGIVGAGPQARVLGTLEVVLLPGAEKDVYSYVNKERCEELVDYRLARPDGDSMVARAEAAALAAWRAIGCRDAGRVDLRADAAGAPNFIEVNPLAGLHPEHSDLPIICAKTGVPYVKLIEWIVESASARVDGGKK